MSEHRRRIENEGHRHIVRRGMRGPLHFENIPCLEKALDVILRVSMTRAWGHSNALNIRLQRLDMVLPFLPRAFAGCRLLFITDLHIDADESLADRMLAMIADTDCDYILLGGDYTFGLNRDSQRSFDLMTKIAEYLADRSRVFGVLGNHDRYSMAECLSAAGVEMLINDHMCIERGHDRLYLTGLDDWHYFHADDLEGADLGIHQDAFKIMLCHSPEKYQEVAKKGYCLYLAGHTHGGQVCLPGGIVLVSSATVPRRMIKGQWRFGGMAGYTSRGVGISGVRARFFCPPEITLITLHKKI